MSRLCKKERQNEKRRIEGHPLTLDKMREEDTRDETLSNHKTEWVLVLRA